MTEKTETIAMLLNSLKNNLNEICDLEKKENPQFDINKESNNKFQKLLKFSALSIDLFKEILIFKENRIKNIKENIHKLTEETKNLTASNHVIVSQIDILENKCKDLRDDVDAFCTLCVERDC